MQKKIIALAVAALASTAAFAQTNVTIYGIADASVSGTSYLGNAGRQTQYGVNSGTLSTSRIGFKGVEDLGNGLKALFVLEYGLGIDGSNPVGYSTTSSAVARQQMVGLTGGFGTAVAGHLQTTGLDFTIAGSALGGSTGLGVAHMNSAVGGTGGLQGNAATHLISALTGGRQSNAVAYISPSFGGVTVAYNHARVTEGAGTAASTTLGNSDWHGDLVSASYDNGPITAGAIYTKVTTPTTSASLAQDNIKEWGLRAGYDFGVAKLQAQYQRAKQDGVTGSDSLWLVSATVPVSAKVALIAEYGHTAVKSTAVEDNVSAATVAATYSLSKRTTAYAGVAAKRVQSNAAAQGLDQNTYALGLRHAF
ncbi:porin [Dechloromonas sp. HYN0024]|uniref:porin n=1 Tax=Dechloromonas sp. HYN0024 TaxID=2231055 RepID=UPI000E44F61E|nr:porin [Dechloromonas sp. HYN0024]AXS80802.1 porin [Dechloromonas sp. HYN0024]